jgi:hypothetical protein
MFMVCGIPIDGRAGCWDARPGPETSGDKCIEVEAWKGTPNTVLLVADDPELTATTRG